VENRGVLEKWMSEAQARHGAQPARPPHWGGYRVLPQAVEFWQGRADRLHDRLFYRRGADGAWAIERLAP
jgi:pyridoxamine 5'-phosphate oxidase